MDIGPGDEVIVTPRSYFASASCIVQVGATPVFADVDRDSQNITAATIEPLITPRTKAILPVHLAGWPCDMPSIMELARTRGLRVIEDCAQAHGARIDGRPVGSFGDAGAFSFCQDKIMSTGGEGGMLITDDPVAWEKGWAFKDHGKSFRRVHSEDHPPGFRWLHESFGSNWRLTEMQAAIGRLQLAALDESVATRRRNAAQLLRGLESLDAIRVPRPSDREYHAYYKFYAFIDPDRLKTGWSRDRILEALAAEGIPGLSGSCPEIYRERAFENYGYGTQPAAAELGRTSLMFLTHPTLSTADIDDIIRATKKVVSAATA
jgi:dTDP-4-amino-4,6-dideoxygalactose transaminase